MSRKKRPWLLRIIPGLFVLGCLCVLLGLAAFAGLIHHYGRNLPDYDQLASYEPPVTTRIYAQNGQLLEEYASEKRVYLPYRAFPPRLVQAFLAAEDQNYFEHPGIDPMAILRAALINLKNYGTGKSPMGGSTITQQVVKNFLLTNEKSLARKIREAILAYRLEQAFSKEKILELYLNEIYLGAGYYGVAAAALNYFDKSVDELGVEEAALLASLPKAPATYNPRRNPERAMIRRNWVLKRMEEEGWISTEERTEAQARPIKVVKRDAAHVVKAPDFAEEIRRRMARTYGDRVLYEGGFFVQTTLDPALQAIAQKALDDGVVEYDRRTGGYRGPVGSLPEDVMPEWRGALEEAGEEIAEGITQYWELAVVLETEKDQAIIGLLDGTEGYILTEWLGWADCWKEKERRLKEKSGASYARISATVDASCKVDETGDVLERGDVIYVLPFAQTEENQPATKDKKAENEHENGYALRQVPQVNGAVVALEPNTGRVLALVGGHSFARDAFNRATQARRQPGSAFKPFVYLTAMEEGYTPSTIVVDAPVTIPIDARRGKFWTPQNYSGEYYGPTTLRAGLEKSRNVMTVRLAQMIGIPKILETAMRFGIYDSVVENYSPVLGALETTLLRLSGAYAMVVNGGKRVEPALIERIQDRYGKTIYRRDRRPCPDCVLKENDHLAIQSLYPPMPEDDREQVTDPQSAYQLVSMMEGVIQRGTGVRARQLKRPLGGKTGTTNESRDAWFMGFSPDLVVGVYIGYDNPRSLGKRETGSSVALPVFIDFMDEALKDKPPVPFRTPPGIRLVRVDHKTGLLPDPYGTDSTIILEAFKPGTEPRMTASSFNAQQYTLPAYEYFPLEGGEYEPYTPAANQHYIDGSEQHPLPPPAIGPVSPVPSFLRTPQTTPRTHETSPPSSGVGGIY